MLWAPGCGGPPADVRRIGALGSVAAAAGCVCDALTLGGGDVTMDRAVEEGANSVAKGLRLNSLAKGLSLDLVTGRDG